MSPDGLIKRCQQGDENAFGELLARHYDTIYATAWRWCGDRSNAEDISQNVCLKLARNIHQYDGRASFTTWLYRLTVNCAKDFYKSPTQHNQRESGEQALDDFGAQQPSQESQLIAQQMLSSIGELASELAETLLLVFVQGLTHQQTGEKLGIKESTVSWRIHEARKQLKRLTAEPRQTPSARGQT